MERKLTRVLKFPWELGPKTLLKLRVRFGESEGEAQNPEIVNQEVLTENGVRGMSTFYGYYIHEVMAKSGDYGGALDVIRDYWGGMLDLGATSFWEDFDINDIFNSGRIDELPSAGQNDIHGDFGEYCYVGYRHSLAHGWASGPTAWLRDQCNGWWRNR